MSSTIETIDNHITLKIYIIEQIHECITAETFDNTLLKISKEIHEIKETYDLGSAILLSDYFMFINSGDSERFFFKAECERYSDIFYSFIREENFLNKIDNIFVKLKSLVIKYKQSLCNKTMRKLFTDFQDINITIKLPTKQYNKCEDCQSDMSIVSASSEILCRKCGKSEILSGIVFEDEQFYYQEGQRTKHGSYDPSKHCKFWIDRIQAIESKKIPENLITDVKKYISYIGIRNIDEMTCEDIRYILRKVKHTLFNEHIPLIRKIITGVVPPQLTDHEKQLIILYFSKAIKIYEESRTSKTNIMYYPYLIYKIIEIILSDPRDKKRKIALLSCIHLQSNDTLSENDNTWKIVCKELNFKFIPTNRYTYTSR
jgi:hypothetical protein